MEGGHRCAHTREGMAWAVAATCGMWCVVWCGVCANTRRCVESGANIVLSRLAIGDLATQYFADRNVFCAGRVEGADMERVSKATGARVQTTVNKLDPAVLGTCADFEEKQVRG